MNGNRSHPPPRAELWTKNQQQSDHSGSLCSLLGRWWPPGQRGLAGPWWWFFVLRHLYQQPRGTHFSKRKNDNQRGQRLSTLSPQSPRLLNVHLRTAAAACVAASATLRMLSLYRGHTAVSCSLCKDWKFSHSDDRTLFYRPEQRKSTRQRVGEK